MNAKAYRIGRRVFHAPLYVVRVDGVKANGSETHGWQVRVPDQPSAFFSDSNYGGPGPALDEAIAHRDTLSDGEPSPRFGLHEHEHSDKVRRTGMPGVYVIPHRCNRTGRFRGLWVVAQAGGDLRERKWLPPHATDAQIREAVARAKKRRIELAADYLRAKAT